MLISKEIANLRHCGQRVPFPKRGRRPKKRGKRQRSSGSVANVHERGDLSASRRFESYLRSHEKRERSKGRSLFSYPSRYEPATLRSKGAVPEARPAAEEAREKACRFESFLSQLNKAIPITRVAFCINYYHENLQFKRSLVRIVDRLVLHGLKFFVEIGRDPSVVEPHHQIYSHKDRCHSEG